MASNQSEGYEIWGQAIMADGDPAKFLEDVQYLGQAQEAVAQWQESDSNLAFFIKDKATGKIVSNLRKR